MIQYSKIRKEIFSMFSHANSDVFMLIFDVLMIVIGAVIIGHGINMNSKKKVPVFFVPQEELKECTDMPGFVKYLLPRVLTFGVVCLLFGAVNLALDLVFAKIDTIPLRIVNYASLVILLVTWFWFSAQLRKGKEKFIRKVAIR